MLRISSRTVTYNPSGWKNVKSIFGRNKKQQKQLVDNLPQKEKEVYLRDRELEKRTAGFNWEETGRSLIYNSERGWWYKFRNRTLWAVFADNCVTDSRIYEETQRESRIIYTFRGQQDLSNWDMMTDENIGGYSRCKMKVNEDNGLSLQFFGIVEQKVPELDWGITSRWSSFAMLYTKPWTRDYGRPDKLNVENHNCFELRFRGDGRKYDFDICATRVTQDSEAMWTTHIYTKGGYEWEVLRIPFYHFFQQHQDAKVMNQTILPIDSITGLRFRIQDDVQGPFKFELDYIATTYDTQFRQFHNKVYQLHLAKGNDLDASYDFSMTNSMKNHYYYDAYNPVLKRTNTLGQDTTARRIDPKHGFLKV